MRPAPQSHRRSSLSEKGQAALAYAARGWAVFPAAETKNPLTPNGVLDATTDPEKIAEWWRRMPDANPAFEPASAQLVAVDFDPGSDRDAVLRQLGLAETKLRSRTPRGGSHEFYELREGEFVAASTSTIAPHVDIRCFHSYVLLPPSNTADGTYEWLSEGKASYRSDELVRVANSAREKHPERDHWIIEPDLPENIDLATAWLRDRAKPAVQGQGGDHCAYATAAHLRSYGISEVPGLRSNVDALEPALLPAMVR